MYISLDGYVTEHKAILYHTDSLAGFLAYAAERLGMRRLGRPHIVQYTSDNYKSVAGLSGVQFISESAITAHTYPELDYIYLDLFSCKEIQPDAIQSVINYLGLTYAIRRIDSTRGHTHLLKEVNLGKRG